MTRNRKATLRQSNVKSARFWTTEAERLAELASLSRTLGFPKFESDYHRASIRASREADRALNLDTWEQRGAKGS